MSPCETYAIFRFMAAADGQCPRTLSGLLMVIFGFP